MRADEVEDAEGNVTLENIVPVEAINATYTVVEAAPAVAYTLEPEDGAIVNDLQSVTISFEDSNVMPNDKMELNAIVLTDEDGEEYYCDAPVRDTRVAQGVAYKLYFLTAVETENGIESELKPITKPGAYTLSILNGTFMRADEVEDAEGNVTLENIVPVEAINASYTVVAADPEIVYVLNPEDGATVEDLQNIVINFPENNNIQYNFMEFDSIVLTNMDTNESYYCDGPDQISRVQSGMAFSLNFFTVVESEYGVDYVLDPITEPGTYRLFIRKGAFLYGDEVEDEDGNIVRENTAPVQEITATYIISTSTGVNGIFGADATEFNVYGVNGVQILKAADRNAVNALPAGMYIINGKKVIKR
ncbi:MAG: hypothetical protein K2J58_07060, partial [Muribaculaceae bacterium]|nr:hypothetical protein [Muribaculaceae bacterium]